MWWSFGTGTDDRIARLQRRRNPPQVWMKDYLRLRRQHGIFWTLLQEFCNPRSLGHSAHFTEFLRIDVELFNEILNVVTPYIIRKDTNFRQCVTPGERLCYYFAATSPRETSTAAYKLSFTSLSPRSPRSFQRYVRRWLKVIPRSWSIRQTAQQDGEP